MSAAENYVPESTSNTAPEPVHTGLIAEGEYRAHGFKPTADLGETSTGKPYVRVHLELLDAPYKGRKIHKDLYFTDKTWARSIQALQGMGWEGEDISQVTGIDKHLVSVTIEQKVQENRDGSIKTDSAGNAIYKNEVAWINTLGVQPMEATKKLSFVEEMKAKMLQLKADAGAAAPGAPAKAAGPTVAEKLKAQVAAKQSAKKAPAAKAAPEPEEPGDDERAPGSDDDIPF